MSNETAPSLPNPFTPLAFLPPDIANQFEVSRYLTAVTLGGYIWDSAVNLESDYQLLFKHKIRYPTIIYYLSRIGTLGYIISSFTFQVGNGPDCHALQVAFAIFYVMSTAFTSLLFVFRVIAVWNKDKMVIAVFTLLWLGTLGGALTIPFGSSGGRIATTRACILTRDEDYTEATAIASMINDSAVFFAITYRILVNSLLEENLSAQFKAFFGRRFLPRLSKNLLQGGQHYYLVALSGNIVLLVLLKLSSLPVVYHAMGTLPVLAVTNSMACIVYRKIKFGLISPDGTSNYQSFHITSAFHAASGRQDATNSSLPMHIVRRNGGFAGSGPSATLHGSASLPSLHIPEDKDLPYDVKPQHVV
ncbi:hypothetical protein D9758_014487 [Tetrapyrgos nigripes]|uniref:Uncharacterized protein n=1 Tax=Tetrapyrgos nigripes TaxID=182062 RepID=A0A8H5FH22_9AGAR|nr:hypothetical protein D9758_014487 [Tetrapyrgos nigripes]